MALTHTPPGELEGLAPGFSLKGVDGKPHRLEDLVAGAPASVIVFMCNHCPYVKAVTGRINQLARDYGKKGVRLVGINSNDAVKYPEDDFASMQRYSRENGYVFPYLFDETQEVARAYGAVCTPDFFVYDQGMRLRYRGRLDDNWKEESSVTRRELASALDALLAGKPVASEQPSSMGCSIKWKA